MAERAGQRVAELRMRSGVARVHWPSARRAAPPLVLWFAPGGAGAERVAACGAVVIAAGVPAFPAARAVLEWAAAHPRSLGADPGPVVIAGDGPGAELAARVAEYAREQGWPPVREVGGGPGGIAAHLEEVTRSVEE
ncbi:alpha/beta hydrolase fold domain-containing protein [Amycolatopsis sp. MJM2582]|uniref:alpha/beta hydrolase fold domain-containing protein n=1 Tax=Amycolatopsis sp. MJM2582 TaxID=1427749 RepID=UPI00068D32F0|nr:alpha/beta hydrolase fold domain-containing protein [Amycolatopsis sp. MJM2582]